MGNFLSRNHGPRRHVKEFVYQRSQGGPPPYKNARSAFLRARCEDSLSLCAIAAVRWSRWRKADNRGTAPFFPLPGQTRHWLVVAHRSQFIYGI
jgi:hypothetical protein